MLNRREFLRSATATAGLCLSSAVGHAEQDRAASARLPNIVVILADDLGYGDVGCYGATKVSTPNIDRLAREGIRFTDAHASAAVCTPTRYAMLTGEYSWRPKRPWDRKRLLIDVSKPTIPSLLKQAGYASGCVGKWHLGFGLEPLDWNGDLKPGPLEIGFDYYFGTPMSHNEPPFVFVENHRVVGLDPNDPITVTPPTMSGGPDNWGRMLGGASARFTGTDLATVEIEKAEHFVDQHKDEQFFLYLATNNVHTPLSPNERFRGSSGIGVYGDYIHELDWMVGRLLKKLDDLDLADNTLVVFSSDNGAVLLRKVWAADHRSNGPLLGQKTDVWEGGHRVPFIVRWPGKSPAGTVSHHLLCLTDLLATFAAVADVALPEEAGQDSLNMLSVFLDPEGAPPVRSDVILLGVGGGPDGKTVWTRAIREGDWLYVPRPGSGGFSTSSDAWMGLDDTGMTNSDFLPDGKLRPDHPPAQLYNLKNDPSQTTNVYEKHPDVVARLKQLLATREGGLPTRSE